jgi:hypothetical protein
MLVLLGLLFNLADAGDISCETSVDFLSWNKIMT